MDAEDDRRITAAEAARRLGVKVETVYAYVSRGYLRSERRPGRPSSFDRTEVEALRTATTRRREHSSAAFTFPALTTRLTDRAPGRLRYRGRDAVELAAGSTVEQVAGLLWTGRPVAVAVTAPAATTAAVRDLVAGLPPTVDTASRLRLAVTLAAGLDPGRVDLGEAAVVRAGAAAISAMLTALGADADADGSVADRLWSALAARDADPRLRPCLHAALILLADHGLAASTVAARAAASARTHVYAVVGAGLTSLEGPLHGAADAATHRLIRDLLDAGGVGGLGDVLALYRSPDGRLPGFARDHPQDVRADALLAMLRGSGAADRALATVDDVRAAVDPERIGSASIECALAVLATSAGMPPGSTATITAVARATGWVAHAVEEYREPPLRWRAREVYTGP